MTLPGFEHADRADFIGAAGIGLAEIARDVERLVEILAVDDIEAEQLFLGLGIGAVDHHRRIFLAQRGRRRGRQQPRHRAEPALLVSLSCTTASFFITAASCSRVQEPTVSSSW